MIDMPPPLATPEQIEQANQSHRAEQHELRIRRSKFWRTVARMQCLILGHQFYTVEHGDDDGCESCRRCRRWF